MEDKTEEYGEDREYEESLKPDEGNPSEGFPKP